jgi:hypothetical protein
MPAGAHSIEESLGSVRTIKGLASRDINLLIYAAACDHSVCIIARTLGIKQIPKSVVDEGRQGVRLIFAVTSKLFSVLH